MWFYFWKLIWPLNLSFVYPRWSIDERNLLSYVPGVLLVVILVWAWWRRRTWGRPVVMLIVCYVALLLPVLGFANIYFMRFSLVADHWQYAAMIVPCATLVGVAVTLAGRRTWGRQIGRTVFLTLFTVLAVLSWRQSRMYANAETLYRATLAVNPDCWLAHNNLGTILVEQGCIDEALIHYQKALQIKPDYAEAHYNRGTGSEQPRAIRRGH